VEQELLFGGVSSPLAPTALTYPMNSPRCCRSCCSPECTLEWYQAGILNSFLGHLVQIQYVLPIEADLEDKEAQLMERAPGNARRHSTLSPAPLCTISHSSQSFVASSLLLYLSSFV
jgi:hypothetical protein